MLQDIGKEIKRMCTICKGIGILMHQAQQAFLESNLVTCARNLTIILASNPTFLSLQTYPKLVTNDACEKDSSFWILFIIAKMWE